MMTVEIRTTSSDMSSRLTKNMSIEEQTCLVGGRHATNVVGAAAMADGTHHEACSRRMVTR